MKKSQAFAQISALNGVVKLSTIINIIKQIDNLKEDTIDKITEAIPYPAGVSFEDLYVDLTYQRKLKVQELFNILMKDREFDKSAAGHIDIVKRPDGRWYVWDGFHRSVLAAIVGLDKMPASEMKHAKDMSNSECIKVEAGWFGKRNGQQKVIEPGEGFKADYVNGKKEALEIFDTLVSCKLNIEGVNKDEDAWDLGGFALFKNNHSDLKENNNLNHLIDASEMIKCIWKDKTKSVSVFFLLGLAKTLEANSSPDIKRSLSHTEIKDEIKKIVNAGQIINGKSKSLNQKDFIQPRIHGKGIESVARNLANRCLSSLYNDNGQELKTFIKYLNFTKDELETFDDIE